MKILTIHLRNSSRPTPLCITDCVKIHSTFRSCRTSLSLSWYPTKQSEICWFQNSSQALPNRAELVFSFYRHNLIQCSTQASGMARHSSSAVSFARRLNIIFGWFDFNPFLGPAKELWKSVTMVSNQGRQRGRSKGLLRIKNLHRGQRLGFGRAKILFPGLTTHVIDPDRKKVKQEEISDDEFMNYMSKLQEIRAQSGTRRGMSFRQTALERGWTSASPQGRHFGAPDSIDSESEFSFNNDQSNANISTFQLS